MQNLSAGLRLRSSDSSVASFSVRSCLLVFCKKQPRFFLWHSFYIADSLTAHPLFPGKLSHLCYVVTVTFRCCFPASIDRVINSPQLAPCVMTVACFSNFRLTKNSVHQASRFSLSCLL
ncbi:hypothetical protein CHARACLAT_029296 [Characodon lateralis]|uniref:Uncharacterized protein n=1 Tax=Characodon lateralis TaxID=208331 RepID=A0ABU7DML9_9TELE|nr:hypothetical protein [Characodon lateralis]